MSGLNDRLVKAPPKGIKTEATIRIVAISLNGILASDGEDFPWPLKEAKTAVLEIEKVAKP